MGLTQSRDRVPELELEPYLTQYKSGSTKPWEGVPADKQQKQVDDLDYLMQHELDHLSQQYFDAFRCFRSLCKHTGLLPSAIVIAKITYDLHGKVFRSTYSDVVRTVFRGRPVAVKILRINLQNFDALQEKHFEEVTTWRGLRHENIAPLLAALGGDLAADQVDPHIVSPWMDNGNLRNYLYTHPRSDRVSFVRQILAGLDFMHCLGVVHGDLKCANVLVDSGCKAYLTDFGISTIMRNNATASGTGTVRGTPGWIAPELGIISEAAINPSPASDIYSLGMLVWEMYTGKSPFDNMTNPQYWAERGFRPTCDWAFPGHFPRTTIWGLIVNCWLSSAELRPPCSKLLSIINGSWPADNIVAGSCQIIESESGAALDIAVGKDHAVLLYERHDRDNQRWFITEQNGAYVIKSGCPCSVVSCAPYVAAAPAVRGRDSRDVTLDREQSQATMWRIIPVPGKWGHFGRLLDDPGQFALTSSIIPSQASPGARRHAIMLPVGLGARTTWSMVLTSQPPTKCWRCSQQ